MLRSTYPHLIQRGIIAYNIAAKKIPSRPTPPPCAKSRSAAPVDKARVLDALGVRRPVPRTVLEGVPEGNLMEREVFSDTGKLDVLVERVTVELDRVVNLMLLLVVNVFRDEVLGDRTEVVELDFKVMTGVVTLGVEVAKEVGTWI